jgi:hypothetical protein
MYILKREKYVNRTTYYQYCTKDMVLKAIDPLTIDLNGWTLFGSYLVGENMNEMLNLAVLIDKISSNVYLHTVEFMSCHQILELERHYASTQS